METRSSATSSDTCTLLPKPPITIVILTWNALDYTKRCLESLCANTDHPDYHVIVADNGSSVICDFKRHLHIAAQAADHDCYSYLERVGLYEAVPGVALREYGPSGLPCHSSG